MLPADVKGPGGLLVLAWLPVWPHGGGRTRRWPLRFPAQDGGQVAAVRLREGSVSSRVETRSLEQ